MKLTKTLLSTGNFPHSIEEQTFNHSDGLLSHTGMNGLWPGLSQQAEQLPALLATPITTPVAVGNAVPLTTAGTPEDVKTALFSDGTMIVAYSVSNEAGRFDIFAQMFDTDGNAVGSEVTLGGISQGQEMNEAEFDLISVSGNGIVAAFEVDDGAVQINARSFTKSGTALTLETDVGVSNGGINSVHNPALTGTGVNDFTIFYLQLFQSDPPTYRQVRVEDGSGQAPDDIRQSSSSNSSATIDAITLADGNQVFLFDNNGNPAASGSNFVFHILDAQGNAFIGPQVITSPDGITSGATMTALVNGGFVVSGTEDDGDNDVFYQVFASNGNAITGFREFGTTSNNNNEPTIAALQDGGFVIFYDKDSGVPELRGQRFDQNGDAVGDDFRVTAGNAAVPDATLLPDGRLAVSYKFVNADQLDFRIFDTSGIEESGTVGDDTITGSAGNDALFGGAGNDTITGEQGNDLIEGGAGADMLDGGLGIDTLSYANSGSGVVVNIDINEVSGGDAEGDTISNFENVIGSAFDDSIFGSANNDRLYGGDGHDGLVGNNGLDLLFGGDGNDNLRHGNFAGDVKAGEIFDGGSGTDSLRTINSGGGVIDFRSVSLTSLEILEFSSGVGFFEGDQIARFGARQFIDAGFTDIVQSVRVGGEIFRLEIFLEDDTPLDLSFLTIATFGEAQDAIRVIGSIGDDVITAANSRMIINGGLGSDLITGSAFADVLSGGIGIDRDTLSYANSDAGVQVDLNTGIANRGYAEGDTISGFDNLIGSAFGDVLTGTLGGGSILGGDGDDIITEIGAQAFLDGGAGNDTLSYMGSANGVTVNLATGEASGGAASLDSFINFENLIGSAADDTLTGDNGGNILTGNGGADTLSGGGGNDTLSGGGGDDIIFGGSDDDAISGGTGDDILDGQSGDDQITGGDGQDTLLGASGNDILEGGADNDQLNGNGGDDTLRGDDGDDLLVGQAGNDLMEGGLGADSLFGSSGNDIMSGDAGNDILNAGGGADQVDGGTGDDIMNGGIGLDTLNGGDGNDQISGGGQSDLINGQDGNDTINGDTGNDLLFGGAGNDNISGNSGADTIIGGDGNDELSGAGGSDTINGNGGLDFLLGGGGNDTLDGGADFDVLFGGGGTDVLFGGDGVDDLYGESGNDDLFGGAGDDFLSGGGGNDDLTGGAGADTFYFVPAIGVDRIKDFEAGTDQIDFTDFALANDFSAVLNAATQIGVNVRLEFNPNNIVVLENVQLSDLTEDDFVFELPDTLDGFF